MEQIKAVGKAIRNSPRAIRKKLGHDQGKHEKLTEDWYHSDDPIISGVSFYIKYLGSTTVEKTHGPGSTDSAVRTIVQDAKHRGGKLQKVQMTVSSRFIKLVDVVQQMKLDELPLYRVSYCTVDPYYDKVFCYIARNHETKGLECHAFLCSKKSKAEAITLTVAQAFNIAYEKWQSQKKKKKESVDQSNGVAPVPGKVTNGQTLQTSGRVDEVDAGIGDLLSSPQPPLQPQQKQSSPQPSQPSPQLSPQPSRLSPQPSRLSPQPSQPSPLPSQPSPQPLLPSVAIDNAAEGISGMSVDVTPASPTSSTQKEPTNPFASVDDSQVHNSDLLKVKTTIPKAVSLDYLQLDDDFDMEFTRLADARSNPHLLAIGDHMNRTNMEDDIMEMMRGEKNADDLGRSKSIDDLLLL